MLSNNLGSEVRLLRVNGELIVKKRKALGLTQQQLAEGICNQGNISIIEKKNVANNLDSLILICQRLGISLEDVSQITSDEQIKIILKEVDDFCSEARHSEALALIKQTIEIDKILDPVIKSELFYYLGITSLIGESDLDSALFYFYEISTMEIVADIIKSLALNGIAICYERKKSVEFAKVYHDRSVEILESKNQVPDLRAARVYYNTAKFYSFMKDYQQAVSLCDKGIAINKLYKSTISLDFLYYEKAFNLYYLGNQRYRSYMESASQLAELNDNEHLIEIIKTDLKEFDEISDYK